MIDIVFPQSESKDPYAFYRSMRETAPVYYDAVRDLWGIYTYKHCETVLQHSATAIPQSMLFLNNLGEPAVRIATHLARLGNSPQHATRRDAAVQIFERWRPIDLPHLIQYMLGEPGRPATIDWVKQIGCRLPAFALLKGLNFSTPDGEKIVDALPALVGIMNAVKSHEEAYAINHAAALIMPLLEAWVEKMMRPGDEHTRDLYVSNLAGLLIQSFDAGRGLLSNALLWAIREQNVYRMLNDEKAFVREVLRIDPPVHHTRRELTADLLLGDVALKKGAKVLIVLASANHDRQQFNHAEIFDPARSCEVSYLSFGAGVHQCMAEHFSINLTVAALRYVYTRYSSIVLQENEITYEPKINVRLPVRMIISLE